MTFTSIYAMGNSHAMSNSHAMADIDPTRLLLQFIAHVQDTGLCSYPALEAHLQRYSEELRSRASEPEATPTASDASPETAKANADGAASDGQVSPDGDSDSEPAAPPTPSTDSERSQKDHPADSQAPEPRCLEAGPAMRPESASGLLPQATEPGGQLAAATAADQDDPSEPEVLNGGGDVPAGEAAMPLSPSDADLDLWLRFREQVQSSGFCDHPELQARLEAHLGSRQLPQGNSRLTAERLQQRCRTLLMQALASLELLTHPDFPSRATGWLPGSDEAGTLATDPVTLARPAAALGQLRHLLVDGVSCYATQLDAPQRRMLRRALDRAARIDRRLQRMLAQGIGGPQVLTQLQTLALQLEVAVEQWCPETEATGFGGPTAPLTQGLDELPRERDATNAIRPRLAPQRSG